MKRSGRKNNTAARLHFCGVREQLGDGSGIYALRTKRPTYRIGEVSGLSLPRKVVQAVCKEAFGRWSDVCDLIFTETDDPKANFLIFSHDFRDRGGVLADCQLPAPGLKQQQIRIDVREKWDFFNFASSLKPGYLDLFRVLAHEMGHGIGLPHFSPQLPEELMEPSYSDTVIKPQPAEIALVQRLYGLPASGPSPTPGNAPEIDLTITVGGKRYRASGKAKPVTA